MRRLFFGLAYICVGVEAHAFVYTMAQMAHFFVSVTIHNSEF